MGLKLKLTTSTGGSMREQYLSQVENPKLHEAINQLYRPNATYGDGGTADAVRYEKATGKPLGNKFHTEKAQGRLKSLERILTQEKLTTDEKELVEKLIKDLKLALEG